MSIMDQGAMSLRVYKKVIAAGGCAMFDTASLSQASTVCTLKTKHGGQHRFEPIVKVLLAFDGDES